MSPHLFTHMFFGGTIISTRKLVYDAGSAEEAIKALMQAQHKAVLKDLKKGNFDEKIDQYLGDTPGLLPRGSVEPDGDAPSRDSGPVIAPPARAEAPSPQPGRTQTAERKSPASQVRTSLPPPPPADGFDAPTFNDDPAEIAAAVAAANATIRNVIPPSLESGPEIVLQLELDDSDEIELEDPSARTRSKHDTDVQMPVSDGIPGSIGAAASGVVRAPGELIQPPLAAPQPLPPSHERKTGDRGSAVGAASLPPARPITRPPSRPAMTPATVMSRPLPDDPTRGKRETDAVEVYAPPPSSADPPPGERPGQYAQHKRASQKIPIEALKGVPERERERSASTPIPSGLARPGRSSGVPQTTAQPPAVPRPVPREPSPGTRAPEQGSRPAERPRTPTPSRFAPPPTPARTATGSSGGVVMTRPAVIVGAPAKPASPPRVRKAREEEGRGFGQGLISEKSLDEVILAYLSEDADEK